MDSLALGRFLVGRCPEGVFLEYDNLGNFCIAVSATRSVYCNLIVLKV